MADKFKRHAPEPPAKWICSWCGYGNIRQNAGLDHCSACGAETLTRLEAPGIIGVVFSRNPDRKAYTACTCGNVPASVTNAVETAMRRAVQML